MPCGRCEHVQCIQDVRTLLVCTPHAATRTTLLRELRAVGVPIEPAPLGVSIDCRGRDWPALVRQMTALLSGPERADTRVATVQSEDPTAVHAAIFAAKSLDELLEHADCDWFFKMLAEDRLVVHLHPLIQHPPGRLHAYECLIRGIDEQGKIVPPGKLFAAAKKVDALFVLDQKARVAAVKKAAKVNRPDTRFFINFIPTAIYNPQHCLQTTLAAIGDSGLRPDQITFEVVETEDVPDRNHLTNILRFYREQGFNVALDDVGAGYSSLLSLGELQPDYIKLDGELVRRAARNSLEARLVTGLAETARQHGIMTVAEGIETLEELRFVHQAGIRITQGYVHCKPSAEPLNDEQLGQILGRVTSLPAAA